MGRQFESLGFVPTHKHPTKEVFLYKQGRINLLLNSEPAGQAANFRAAHGPSASGMAFRVADAKRAYDYALSEGAIAVDALYRL
jgi:4-hydroxyphenylpyruvate dioxygenase